MEVVKVCVVDPVEVEVIVPVVVTVVGVVRVVVNVLEDEVVTVVTGEDSGAETVTMGVEVMTI